MVENAGNSVHARLTIPSPTEQNHYRPIALTSLVMKCLEQIVKKHVFIHTHQLLDPLQFAYRPSRGVDDAIVTLLHLVYTHLEAPKTHVKIIFFDFSSAFNTINPNILAQRLVNFGLDGGLILWLLDFLSQRVQQVKVGSSLSDKIITNTGSPQGCVLSPLLFILYTNNCSSPYPGRYLIKFADDTALVSLLKESEQDHGPVLPEFLGWCEQSNLLLNTLKTKEMSIDFRKDKSITCSPTTISGQPIQSVTEYKYLGVVLDNKLKWEQHTEVIQKKGQQRLYFLKKLVSFDVDQRITKMFYSAFVESVLTFGILCWFGNATEAQKGRLRRIVTTASKLMGTNINIKSLEQIHRERSLGKIDTILADVKHPLFNIFELLPSGSRFRYPALSKNRTKKSFIPQAISLFNKHTGRPTKENTRF
ncbi:putative RNA-directed DNA polymerase from transposon X-element [Merluccius polli]|uniref:RNA-directed DNA polymerase from transposon X-element n=1 Tax=Merluccius polli TaxID=89951 RepID=A0AA47NSQ1_MERPO|nr:putative RNA-directed DNA polymerase from transposon X-element [Merluccius polli]